MNGRAPALTSKKKKEFKSKDRFITAADSLNKSNILMWHEDKHDI